MRHRRSRRVPHRVVALIRLDPAVPHLNRPPGRCCDARIVRHENHRLPVYCGQTHEQFDDAVGVSRIEGTGRFVRADRPVASASFAVDVVTEG
jgi:hypothetical protein